MLVLIRGAGKLFDVIGSRMAVYIKMNYLDSEIYTPAGIRCGSNRCDSRAGDRVL